MRAYLFPGQGAQTVQMAEEILTAFPAAAALYKEAQEITGLDLTNLTEEELGQTRYSQPAIVVHSAASLLREHEQNPVTEYSPALAGFSLGEYTALHAAGVITFTDLMRLVDVRSRLMQETAESVPGAMYAVIGLADEAVENCLSSYADVYPVNYNCNGQLVIAGLEASAAEAAAELQNIGARRVMRLAVNGAFHTPLMSSAAARLREFAATLSFASLDMPLYSNATGARVTAPIDWPSYLETHMISPVRFTAEIRTMREDGYTDFTEVGPGKVLSGLVKKI